MSLTDSDTLQLNLNTCHKIFGKNSQWIEFMIIICAAYLIPDKLRNLNIICRARWFMNLQEWKVDYVKIEIITFIIQLGVRSVVVTHDERQV